MTGKSSVSRGILYAGVCLGLMTGAASAQTNDAGEIVVTASGRVTALQETPIAVTAVSGEAIVNAGVENLQDIAQVAPSVRVMWGQSTSAGTIVRLRGLGTGGDNPAFESAVGFFIDGVYRARAGSALSDFPALDRVEVLRGPQGTLFGRNTSAGAVSVHTSKPSHEFGAWLETGIGDLDYGALRAGVEGAAIDNVLALRLDAAMRGRDGYMHDYLTGARHNGQDRWQVRGQALWDITSNASLRIIADTAQTNEDCCSTSMALYGAGAQSLLDGTYRLAPFWNFDGYTQFVRDNIAPVLYPGAPGANTLPNTDGRIDVAQRYTMVTPGRDYSENVEEWGISGELNWRIGSVDFTSITAYRDWSTLRNQDTDITPVDIVYRDGLTIAFENFSQEFRLQGEFGRARWLVGAYYSREDLDTTDTIRQGADAVSFINANAILATTAGYIAGGLPAAFEIFDTTAGDSDGVDDPVPSIFNLFAAPGDPTQFANAYLAPNPSGSGQNDRWLQETEEFSLFTHNEVDLTDRLTLTLGLRFTHQTRELRGILDSNVPACLSLQQLQASDGLVSTIMSTMANPANPLQPLSAAVFGLISVSCMPQSNTIANTTMADPWAGSREENEWSGVLSLAYEVNDGLMLYGRYARGFKSGGFNAERSGFTGLYPGLTNPAALNVGQLEYEPEFVDSYEAGVRSTLFGGTTFLNATVFYQELHDYQMNASTATAFITRNMPRAISQGVEIDVLARLTPDLTVQGGLNYTDAYNDATVAFVPGSAANTVYAGTPLVHAPEWSATAALTYRRALPGNLEALMHLDARYDTTYWTQILGRNPISDQPDTAIFNARLGVGSAQGNWRIDVWGRNLTDELVWSGFSAPLQSGSIGAYVYEPRTWGVTMRVMY